MYPRLVYNCGADDYVNCLLGEERGDEKLPKMCTHGGGTRDNIKPWELNYPSIMVKVPKVPKDGSTYSWLIPRRLTNVGTTSDTYNARITGHTDVINIKIEPSTLHFNAHQCEENFSVILIINKEDWTKTNKFYTTCLEWRSEKNKHECVRSPIVIIGEESHMLK